MQFIIAKSTPFMITGIGYGTYFFFGASTTVAFVWVWFLLPETKGLRLEEMDVIFGLPGSDTTSSKDDSAGQSGSIGDVKEETQGKMTSV
jgi:Sugar (and other) transporter